MPNDFNTQIITEFRANGGRVGGPFEGGRLILLTTTGSRSGAPHTTPLGYLPEVGGRILVIASAGGAPRHPDWFHNVLADPQVTVEDGIFTYPARATVLAGAERDEVFARATEADPGWAAYQAKTSRTLPVVALERTGGGPPEAPSWGAALIRIHDAFRRELALIRREAATTGPRLGAQLRVNCLAICQGLHHHHTQEDGGMFVGLAAQHPQLAPTLERLRAEHVQVAGLVDRLQAVLGDQNVDPAEVRRQVDQLIEELERHLAYEEEQLVPLLDAMG
ncbi:nitroreductase family deazaflavin-dependent oxidoreductase [Micromonospora sp. WP24]|nr:nitroreductase family deazaflavin-dependent oxidoreductase [Micromonospora sp. WP24]